VLSPSAKMILARAICSDRPADLELAFDRMALPSTAREYLLEKVPQLQVLLTGLGKAEGFEALEELAGAFGGAVAATRAVVDAGWYSYSAQIGQTGKTVSPKLYLAAGISGAIQHKVGMQGSENIVAINKDANAPIFEFSDLGIVGDLNKIVPKLTEAVKARKGG